MRRPWSRTVPDGTWDAIVVGSGISGLTCAAMLAKKGMRTLVLEQHHTPGGLIQTFVRGRFRFDTGLHVLGELAPKGLPARLLTTLTDGQARFVPLGPLVDRIHTAGDPIDLPAGRGPLIEAMATRFPGSRARVRAYVDAVARAATAAGLALLARHLPPGLDGMLDRAAVQHGEQMLRRPAQPWIHELLGDTPEAAALCVRGAYHGTPLDRAAAGAHAAVTHHYVEGAWAPATDSRDIVRGLARTIATAGGWVAVNSPAARVDLAAGKVDGLYLAGGRRLATARVISAIGAHNSVALLADPPAAWAAALRALPLSQAHLGLYLGLASDPAEVGATSASHWARVGHPWFRGIYLRFPTVGGRGPHRATVTTVLPSDRFADPGPHLARTPGYRELKQDLQAYLLDEVRRMFPGIGPLVRHAELSTPATTEHFVRAPTGAMYGLAATVERFACEHLRATTPIPGFFLAGTDIGMSGVVGGLMAGAHAAVAVQPRTLGLLVRATLRPKRGGSR